MKSKKHTRGPWSYKRTHRMSGDAWYVIVDSKGYGPVFEVGGKDENGQIAVAKYLVTDPQEIEANAARIVACVNACEGINPEAVPMMVEALEDLYKPLAMGWKVTDWDLRLQKAEAVLAKAKGET